MKRIIIILISCMAFLSLVSAITVYSGEPIVITLEEEFSYWSVVGNSTEVILDITQEGNNVTIIPDKYSFEDAYEIIFFNVEKETITVYQSSGGGGGSRTRYVDRNVTEYVDREIIEYIDKEVEVPGEINIIEKITNKTPWYMWVIVLILIIIVIYLFFIQKREIDERGYKQDEQKNDFTPDVNPWN